LTDWVPWKVAKKDFKVIRRKRSIIGYTAGLPPLLAVALSLIVRDAIVGASVGSATVGMATLTFVFVILAAVLPTSMAAYSIVGEKVEKSLEPLLATPTSDGDLLLGKALAAFLPAVLAVWAGAFIFMAAADSLAYSTFSGYYFPSWVPGIILFLVIPLAAMLGVEVAITVSSRVSDVRGANQLAGLMYVPFLAVMIGGADGGFSFDVTSLLVFSGILVVADVAMFFVSKSTFNREKILTKWK